MKDFEPAPIRDLSTEDGLTPYAQPGSPVELGRLELTGEAGRTEATEGQAPLGGHGGHGE
ncbi:TPA: hypothetical protein DEQ95_04265 [Candidatus Beckwithbacteria bacterium]|nr:MAG: hypothetical protein UY43_C0001G0132 [Candidatus Beckwithbacteria bacterium GW2011_GWC1_49_16]OGD48530.1 MAG: hypothetical protein A2877_02170 [Candidatus Beckwithbacteria bacterium RIFCSPHIGHO2_01_FULL_49_39]OGD50635.1 MAG: hypothetical protein A3D86_00835 [Candidatus Beckwithbacteria bacterium RIFCSPHIGHO2_02_FULL_49_13]OGD51450.1 MAG: hypothetical protein A3K56_04415 [Candidatus Beckwithbacteria bacterium RIFCSPHIGHO2_12_FULL_49_13]OGD58545.1 MAG: hypothetical protein A3J22_05250 [Ca